MDFPRRQLLKLLSFSSLGAAVGFRAPNNDPECITTTDILGPFYVEGAPETPMLAPMGAEGTPLFITGTVYGRDCMTPLPNALVDVWHASDAGDYTNDQYRGKVYANANGQYSFQTILPGKYLNGAQFRPRHLHYKTSFMETELTTQIYFEGDTSIPIDPWASTPEAVDRIIPLSTDDNGNLHGIADIYLDAQPVINDVTEISSKRKRSYIESVFPNPMIQEGKIVIQLAANSTINIKTFDLNGRLVQTVITEEKFSKGKHEVHLTSNNSLGIKLPSSIYILRMEVNQIPVDTTRIIIK